MNADEPTHFNYLILGTGLTESILAAALSKAGYSLLQLDRSSSYGDTWASLFLDELIAARPSTSILLDDSLLSRSGRFSLSLKPVLLPARGPAIDVLIRSKVAAYLQFGLLGGVGLWTKANGIKRAPASKADVFNDTSLSLVEKRRLTKLLLFVAGGEKLEDRPELIENPAMTFQAFLQRGFSVSPSTSESLSYALSLCSSSTDTALPALRRLRTLILSTGLYGPSSYLVGHYGGAGDLVGGFSRLCAVWGGGQILGRQLHPLITVPSADVGPTAPSTPLPFAPSSDSHPPAPPPPPSQLVDEVGSDSTKLGVPVSLEEGKDPVVFTADRVVCAPSHLDVLFPPSTSSVSPTDGSIPPHSVSGIVILTSSVTFPASALPSHATEDEPDTERDRSEPDSSLFVFPPQALTSALGTVTALQVGSSTNSCPEGFYVLYLSAPFSSPPSDADTASSLLTPYLQALTESAPAPAFTSFSYHFPSPTPSMPASLPPNLVVSPALDAETRTSGLVESLDEAAVEAEKLFWDLVGEEGRNEGVEFFKQEARAEGDDE